MAGNLLTSTLFIRPHAEKWEGVGVRGGGSLSYPIQIRRYPNPYRNSGQNKKKKKKKKKKKERKEKNEIYHFTYCLLKLLPSKLRVKGSK